MRIKVLEDQIKAKDRKNDRFYDLVKDDVLTVPDDIGERWCGLGWAEDVAEEVETGERKPGAVRLSVENLKHVRR